MRLLSYQIHHCPVYLTLALLIVFTSNSLPQEPHSVPWDSIVATVKMIESADLNDSLRSGAIGDFFTSHNIDSVSYRRFYNEMLSAPPVEQKQFIDRVKAILSNFSKTTKSVAQKRIPVIQPIKLPDKEPSGR